MELFKFELEENKEPLESTNINSIRVYFSDEEKELIECVKDNVFKKNKVDNLSDYILKKMHEDAESK